MDVALECLGTLQGDTQRTYTLVPSDAAQTNKRPSGWVHTFSSRVYFDQLKILKLNFVHLNDPKVPRSTTLSG